MHRAMHQFAPRAIRGGIYFARRSQDTPADDRPCIVGALARGPVFITPAHRQDFADRITLRLAARAVRRREIGGVDRKSTRLNSSHGYISYAVFCLKKKKNTDKCWT